MQLRCAVVLLLVAGVSSRASSQTSHVRGTLMIVGGGPQPPALVQQFVDLAGGKGRARIIVFGMASEDGEKGGEEKARELRRLGANSRNVWVNRAQANTDSVALLLEGATGIWFIGGDQVKLIAALRGTKVDSAMHALYRDGAVIGGTSAGAAVMSAVMLTGDERHPGGARPDTSTGGFMTIARGDIVVDSGFGFLRDAIVDQHFLRRKRHNRLISVALEDAPHLAVGIDESTALIVPPSGPWRVAGESVVIVYDARHSHISSMNAGALGATDIRMHVLPAGATFDPKTGVARLP
ncbi:MAG TPA: cyanophycinase [Gemmatimonadaceae bacterium]|nr:cyanophycinase [Gemmatimonadaceae bacterium]